MTRRSRARGFLCRAKEPPTRRPLLPTQTHRLILTSSLSPPCPASERIGLFTDARPPFVISTRRELRRNPFGNGYQIPHPIPRLANPTLGFGRSLNAQPICENIPDIAFFLTNM